MLTIPLGTITGLEDEPFTGFTGNAIVALRFPTICTSFEHESNATTFSGLVTLAGGHLYAELFTTSPSTGLSTTFTEGDETFPFTVASGTFNPTAGTGSAEIAGVWTEVELDELSIATISARLTLDSLSLEGTTAVVGFIFGNATLQPLDTTVSAEPRPFSLTVGASCF